MKNKIINSSYVYSENNIVSIKTNKENNEWYPINFQWIPIMELSTEMNK